MILIMNPLYTSRQRKIYNDYNSWTSPKLLEILKSRDSFNNDIIGIIEEILKDRNISIPSSPGEAPGFSSISDNEYITGEKRHTEKEETLRKYKTELREKPVEEIAEIITRYSYFQIDRLEAAMSVAVDRGIISYDLSVSLQKQMTENMNSHWDRKSSFAWETENAFIGYVSRYSDDEIYDLIDNPKEMVIDVYHAVLSTALNRELISNEDFNEFFKGAKSALTTDYERRIDEIHEYLDLPEPEEDPFNDNTVKAEAARYRKCPLCHELVDAELSLCWNCQAEMPESAPVAEIEEMRQEMISEQKGFGMHPLLLVALITLVIFGAAILRSSIRHGDPFEDKYLLIIFGIFLIGVFLRFAYKYFKIMKD